MTCSLQTERFTLDGREFEAVLYPDDSGGRPWESECGHGDIRVGRGWYQRPHKGPGEVILHSNRGDHWIYDFAGAVKKARNDWGFTNGPDAVNAVREDMTRLRRFLEGEWFYIGVSVRIIGRDGEPESDGFGESLWGVESDGEYWREVAQELAENILHPRREAWRAALNAARESRNLQRLAQCLAAPVTGNCV